MDNVFASFLRLLVIWWIQATVESELNLNYHANDKILSGVHLKDLLYQQLKLSLKTSDTAD